MLCYGYEAIQKGMYVQTMKGMNALSSMGRFFLWEWYDCVVFICF